MTNEHTDRGDDPASAGSARSLDSGDAPAGSEAPAGPDRAASIAALNARITRLVEARAALDVATRERDRSRATLESLRRRPIVAAADVVSNRLRPVAAGARSARTRLRDIAAGIPVVERVVPLAPATHRLRSTAARERQLVAAFAALPAPASPGGAGESAEESQQIVAIVRSTDPERSRATLAWLASAGIDRAVLVPADATEGGPLADFAPAGGRVQVAATRRDAVALVEATNHAAGGITAPHLLFLHDDVRPIDGAAVARLSATLESRPDLASVTGLLILPSRRGPARGPTSDPADLTVGEAGVAFEPRAGRPTGIRLKRGTPPAPAANGGVSNVPAVSAAALLVRAGVIRSEDLDRDDGHDLSVALAVANGGGSIGVASDAGFFHDEAAEPDEQTPPPWLGRLRRALLLDRLDAAGAWSPAPFHLGITVTRNDESAGYGDWYTAHELGDAVERLGWRVTYVERHQDHWYQLPDDLDALVVLIDLYDLSRVPAGVIRIAWARNWMDHWIEREWFDDYDLVLVSSTPAKEMVDTRTAAVAHVFPIATNPDRFHPGPAQDELRTDVAFVGSHFGRPRGVAAGLPAIAAAGRSVGVWGRDWETVEGMANLTRGQVAYDGVPDVYRSTSLVVDDNLATTLELGMLNSRVFDALATGALILTNNATGARDLFDDEFPTWSDASELERTALALLDDDDRRRALVERYQRIVLERHTYAHRAEELRSLIADWARAERWAIATGPRNREAARTWGDTYFARAVQRQLARRGRPTTVWVHDEWPAGGGGADVVIHLFGARAPIVVPGPVNVLWVISHPERITPATCAGYDRVAVASDRFAADLASGTAVPVLPLHQATDPDRFHPTEGGPVHEVLFVGSSRGQRRPVVDAAAASGRDLAVYGGGWTDELIDLRHLRGEWVPNDELAAWYSSAAIVLTDHYDDMRELGFISNRVYDALACRTLVVSDDVAGLDEEFDGAVVACRTPDEVAAALDRYLADPAGRTERAERGRAAVVARHTFGHRVDTLIATVEPVLAERPDARRRPA